MKPMLMLMLFGLFAQTVPALAADSVDFECRCKEGSCSGVENLTIHFHSNAPVDAHIADFDYEFSEQFALIRVEEPVTIENSGTYTRYNIPSDERPTLPKGYNKGEYLLMSKNMKIAGTNSVAGRSKSTHGTVLIVSSKGQIKFKYLCH